MYVTARLLAHTSLPSLAPLAAQAATLKEVAFLQGAPMALVEVLGAVCPPVAARLHSELSRSPEMHVRKLCSSSLRPTPALVTPKREETGESPKAQAAHSGFHTPVELFAEM